MGQCLSGGKVLAWWTLEWDDHGHPCIHMQEEKICRYVRVPDFDVA